MGEHVVPAVVDDRPRRLRDVAEDRERAAACAARHHPELHRGQVLRFVDDHVPERPRRLGEQRARLVEERDVVVTPRETGPWAAKQSLLAVVEDLLRRLREARGCGEEGANEGVRGGHRPDPAQPAREEALRVQRALDLGEVAPGEAAEPRAVVLVEPPQDVHPESLACVRRQPELLACALGQLPDIGFADTDVLALHPRHELLRTGGRAEAPGARQHLGEPDVALEPLDVRRVDDRRLDAVDELAHRPLLDALLSERRQDVRDVLHERRVGPHHEHAPELLAMGVEEVRGPVQADRRLSGSRPALDDERRLGPRVMSRYWSVWIVATMSRMRGSRLRSSSSRRKSPPTTEPDPSSFSSLRSSRRRPSVRNRRRSVTSCGLSGVAT